MAGLPLPASIQQPLGRSAAPRGNTYEAREVNIGRIQSQFSGGPQRVSGVGEGLKGLAGGLDKWAAVFERQEQQKQTLDAIKEMERFEDLEREALDQMGQMRGADGVELSIPHMEGFYEKNRADLMKTARGDFQKMIFEKFLTSKRDQGLNAAFAHRTRELENDNQQTLAGLKATALSQVESDPAQWRQSAARISMADRALNPGRPEVYQAALDDEYSQAVLESALKAAVASGDMDLARSIMSEAYAARPSAGGASVDGAGGLTRPYDGQFRISSKFGPRGPVKDAPGASRDHKGVDIAMPVGTEVKAAGSGQVVFAGKADKAGIMVTIKHDDGAHESQVLHLSELGPGIEAGARVEAGQVIAKSGNTGESSGPHLDFRIKKHGQYIDPEPFLAGEKQSAKTETGPDKPVLLAENRAAGSGEVASDASGAAPSDAGQSEPSPAGAQHGGLFSQAKLKEMRQMLDHGESRVFLEANKVRLINGEMPEVQAELANLLREDKITAEAFERVSKDLHYIGEQGVRAAVQEEERAYETKYRQLLERGLGDISQPEFMSELRGSGLYQRDQNFIQSLVIGQTEAERKAGKPYRDKAENVIQMAIIEGDVTSHKELQRLMSGFTGLFNFEDVEKYRKWLDDGLGQLGKRADEWLDINADALEKAPGYAKAKAGAERNEIRNQIKSRAVRTAASMGVGRDDTRFDQLMTKLVTETDENEQPLYLSAQPDLKMWDLARDDRKDGLVKRKLDRCAEEYTETNKLRAREALEKNLPLGAVLAPGAEKWRGRGRVEIGSLGKSVSQHRDEITKAGNAHDVDPEFLASLTYAVWRAHFYEDKGSSNGLVEMTPDEAAALGVADPKNPEDNLRGLARRVAERLEANGGDYDRVIDELIQDEKARKYCRLTYQRGRTPFLQEF